MPNIKSAEKRLRQQQEQQKRNLARKTAIKTSISKVKKAIDQDLKEEKARELLHDVEAKLWRAKSKGTIHANTAARKMSRLAQKVNKAYAGE